MPKIVKKKIVKPARNIIKKLGKQVVTLGEGKHPINLPSRRTHGEYVGRGPSQRGPPDKPRPYKTPTADAVYIDAPQLRSRYGGRSHMWLVRLQERDPTFPRPTVVGRLRFWRLDALEKWERETAAKSTRTRAA